MSTTPASVDPPIESTSRGLGGTFWVAIALFVLTRLFLLLIFQPDSSDASHLYFGYATRGVDLGQTAYKDYVVEYPPVAWWAMAAPRWVDPVKLAGKTARHDLERARTRYHRFFRWEMFLCDAAAFALFISIVRRRRPEMAGIAALGYVITTSLLAHLLYDRLDPGLSLFIMSWAYCWVRSLESPGNAGWVVAAYLLLGISISFKLVPVIIVPFLLLAHLYAPGRWRNVPIGVAMLALGIVIPFVIVWPTAGSASLKFLSFHSGRGLHIESLPASLLIAASWFGLEVEIVHPFWGFDLDSAWSPLVKTIFSAGLFGFLALAGLKALIEWRRYTPARAYQFALWVIVTSVVLATVLSPQYFVWAMPLMLLLGSEVLPRKRAVVVLTVALILITAVSTWIYPYHYFPHDIHSSLIELDRSVTVLLLARNFAYLLVVAWLGWMLMINRPASAAIPAA